MVMSAGVCQIEDLARMCAFSSEWRGTTYWPQGASQPSGYLSSSSGLSMELVDQQVCGEPLIPPQVRRSCVAQRPHGATAGQRGRRPRCYRQTRQGEPHCCRGLWFLLGWELVLLRGVAEPSGGSPLLPKYQASGLTHLSPWFLKMTIHSTLKKDQRA